MFDWIYALITFGQVRVTWRVQIEHTPRPVSVRYCAKTSPNKHKISNMLPRLHKANIREFAWFERRVWSSPVKRLDRMDQAWIQCTFRGFTVPDCQEAANLQLENRANRQHFSGQGAEISHCDLCHVLRSECTTCLFYLRIIFRVPSGIFILLNAASSITGFYKLASKNSLWFR
jgi:hypothetical protein